LRPYSTTVWNRPDDQPFEARLFENRLQSKQCTKSQFAARFRWVTIFCCPETTRKIFQQPSAVSCHTTTPHLVSSKTISQYHVALKTVTSAHQRHADANLGSASGIRNIFQRRIILEQISAKEWYQERRQLFSNGWRWNHVQSQKVTLFRSP